MIDRRAEPKDFVVWGLYNFGNLWGVYRTRKEARREAEEALGESWKKCRGTMEVHRVRVSLER